MKARDNYDDILTDVFGESSPDSWREEVLARSIRQARRTCQLRRAARASLALIMLALTVLVVRRNGPHPIPIAAHRSIEHPYILVQSKPLPSRDIILTKALPKDRFDNIIAVETVRTTSGNYRLIGDGELLSLLSPHPCALIKLATNAETLVFVRPEDARLVLAN